MSTTPPQPYSKLEKRRRNPDPKSAVLLVIDAQNHFSSITKPILQPLKTTINLCRTVSIPIIFTRHSNTPNDDCDVLGEWWNNDLIIDGTEEAELMPEIVELMREEDKVVEKSTYSAFRGTGLEEWLVERGVKEVVVTGVMTNLCCETTARDAFVRGFRVFFSTDATATEVVELHEATIMNMAFGFAYLVDCGRLSLAFNGN
ncbi:hypothetical protein Sjap_024459 [Stephania japonica]|uniref:Isochorismatase-like domain-containing protein n=1 Tax=Stephania japonica TaxID=461633 RepID=A0AAP0EGN3_9MAGN